MFAAAVGILFSVVRARIPRRKWINIPNVTHPVHLAGVLLLLLLVRKSRQEPGNGCSVNHNNIKFE